MRVQMLTDMRTEFNVLRDDMRVVHILLAQISITLDAFMKTLNGSPSTSPPNNLKKRRRK